MSGKQKKLTLKLIMMVVATSTIMTTLSSLIQIGYEYSQEKNQLESSLQAIEKTGIESLKSLVWTVDYPGISRQIDSILLIPEVVRIRVLEENGTVISEKSKNDSDFKRIKHIEFNFTQEDSTSFGKADFYYTTDYLMDHLKRRVVTIIVTNFIKTFLASAVLMFLFSHFVVNPITTLAQSFDQNLWKDLSEIKRVSLKKRGESDEIDALCDGVNSIFGLIEEATKKNKQRIADQQTELVIQSTNTQEAIKKVDEAQARLRAEQAASAEARRIATVGVLAQGMAHEINNPLTIIKGQVWRIEQMLEQADTKIDDHVIKVDYAELHKRVANMQKSIGRINHIIGSLKKLGAAGNSGEKKVVIVQNLLEDVKNLMASVCSQAQVDFIVDGGDALNSQIKVKESEMVQILVNLVNNSLEALELNPAPAKWIKLTAEVTSGSEAGHIYFKVTDCGLGIPPDIAQKIFLPFFTTKSVGKGTGLGLSVVHQMVTEHGGQIYLSSDVSNTEFVIKLPRAA